MGKEKHDLVSTHLQHDWRTQCQRHDRSWFRNRHVLQRRQSGSRLGPRETDFQVSLCFLQFKYWFTYFLLGFVVVTLRESFENFLTRIYERSLVTEIYYLNVALALFNTGKPHTWVIGYRQLTNSIAMG